MTTFSPDDLLTGTALDAALHAIVGEAQRVLDAVHSAGAAVHRAEPAPVRAASSRLAAEVDDAQYALGQGPCLQAFRTGAVVMLDLDGADRRWPEFQAVASRCGARTVLSVPLRVDQRPVGSLNLYSRAARAFTAREVREAEVFARPSGLRLSPSGVAAHAVEAAEVAGLELQDRTTVERALGVLMAVHRDASVERARRRLEEAAGALGLDVPLAAARLVAAPPARGDGGARCP